LKRSPCTRMTSPRRLLGARRSSEPSITVVGRLRAMAFRDVPRNVVMPPSPISGTPFGGRRLGAVVDGGGPAARRRPATTRRRADRARSDSHLDGIGAGVEQRGASPQPVATFPAITSDGDGRSLILRTISSTPDECPCAVVDHEHVDTGRDQRLRAPRPPRDRRRQPRRHEAGRAGRPSSPAGTRSSSECP